MFFENAQNFLNLKEMRGVVCVVLQKNTIFVAGNFVKIKALILRNCHCFVAEHNFQPASYSQRDRVTRIPDLVVWPKSHTEVVEVVRAANKFDVVIIPFGGTIIFIKFCDFS